MKKKILAVDDEKGFRDMYVYLLEPMGIEVTCASNGAEAVEKIKESAYDLVLMDVHMPILTGREAFKQIKQIRPDQKIIIFSSSSDPNLIFEKQARQEGAIDCLFKPCDLSEIRQVLEKAIGPLGDSEEAA